MPAEHRCERSSPMIRSPRCAQVVGRERTADRRVCFERGSEPGMALGPFSPLKKFQNYPPQPHNLWGYLLMELFSNFIHRGSLSGKGGGGVLGQESLHDGGLSEGY